ncbi:MAG TPA: hypothetical protein VGF45_04690 [Polyangia bacterium]
MRTRLGFPKNGTPADPPAPPTGDARGAYTWLGRPRHGHPGQDQGVQDLGDPDPPAQHTAPPTNGTPSPASTAVPPVSEPRPTGGRRTGPSGKSGFPARAGFWGRRNSEGALVPLTEPVLITDRSGKRRRRGTLRAAAVLCASAILSFLAVIGLMHVWTQIDRADQTPRTAPAG